MPFADFVHPCDYNLIRNLVPSKVDKDTDETPVKVNLDIRKIYLEISKVQVVGVAEDS